MEHIEVRVAEPVARSRKDWPAPTSALRKLNLHRSTITDRAFADLLNVSCNVHWHREASRNENFFIPIPHCQSLIVLNPVTSNSSFLSF